MKKIYFLFLGIFLFLADTLNAQVVINEVYCGGGNSGATYKNDFIELYNTGGTSVNLAGWSVQYASSVSSLIRGSRPPTFIYTISKAD